MPLALREKTPGLGTPREQLGLMLDREYDLLIERLNAVRGGRTAFFVFADTVAALRALGAPTKPTAGWVRFQSEPAECHYPARQDVG